MYKKYTRKFDGLAQDCSNSIANALELLRSCTDTVSVRSGVFRHNWDSVGTRGLYRHNKTSLLA